VKEDIEIVNIKTVKDARESEGERERERERERNKDS
jgi:hypothetical protein